jgi:hypothetical protein
MRFGAAIVAEGRASGSAAALRASAASATEGPLKARARTVFDAGGGGRLRLSVMRGLGGVDFRRRFDVPGVLRMPFAVSFIAFVLERFLEAFKRVTGFLQNLRVRFACFLGELSFLSLIFGLVFGFLAHFLLFGFDNLLTK